MRLDSIQIPNEFRDREVWIKVVQQFDNHLVPCSGGSSSFVYPAPTQTDDGWVPGAWTRAENPICCYAGYHVTMRPNTWCDNPTLKMFWVECAGQRSISTTEAPTCKTAFASVRLIRPVTALDVLAMVQSGYEVTVDVLSSVLSQRLVAMAVLLAILHRFERDVMVYPDRVVPYTWHKGDELDFQIEVRRVLHAMLAEYADPKNVINRFYVSAWNSDARAIAYAFDHSHYLDGLKAVATLAGSTASAYDLITMAAIIEQIPAECFANGGLCKLQTEPYALVAESLTQ